MDPLQTEIQDNLDRSTEHFNGTADTTGAIVAAATNKPLQLVQIFVPVKGPNANVSGAILLVSWDGTNFMSYPRGTTEFWPGMGYGTYNHQIYVKAYSGTVKYEIKVLS